MGSSRAKRDSVAEGNDPKGEAQPSNPSGRAIFYFSVPPAIPMTKPMCLPDSGFERLYWHVETSLNLRTLCDDFCHGRKDSRNIHRPFTLPFWRNP
jgi:hypothetical protein